jgi:hypothetical protein
MFEFMYQELKKIRRHKAEHGSVPPNCLDLIGKTPQEVDAIFSQRAASRGMRRARTMSQTTALMDSPPSGSHYMSDRSLAKMAGHQPDDGDY